MAANTAEIFPLTGIAAPGVAITARITNILTGAGATDLFTASTDGSTVRSISFMPAKWPGGGMIFIYYDVSGTKTLIGRILIPPLWNASEDQVGGAAQPIVWTNPNSGLPMANGHKFCAGFYGNTGIIHAFVSGAHY